MSSNAERIKLSPKLADFVLRLISWQVDVTLPKVRKYVVIGAPHTTGWDLFYLMLMKLSTGIDMKWVGKDTLFRWPLGVFMRWLGGVPVKRHSNNNFVEQIAEQFRQREELIIAIAPEGSRGKTSHWRTGFYYIALGADVPIALGFIDYPSRVIGIGPSLLPSGDIQADFSKIKAFYDGKTGRYPERQGDIQLNIEKVPLPGTPLP
jgi:1-acyl-sn-glycerol-3-phosphate acyltransferase